MSAALVRDRMPYPLPPIGAPVRVTFLGAPGAAAAHALHEPAGGLEPRFVDVRAVAAVAEPAPHVVIVLSPERVPPAVLAGLRAATLAVAAPHTVLPTAYDRVLRSPGPGGAAGAWRSRPLPVDDRLYADVRPSRRPPRALFVGRSTGHREHMLTLAKHSHDVVHYSHGLVGEELAEQLAATDVGIAVLAEPAAGFPAQALLHLAAGQLLLSEPPRPLCGLEPGIDHLPIDSPESLNTILMQLRLRPDAYERVRVRGRQKADQHRASVVWPRIVHDLLQDIRVFGTSRAAAGNTLTA